MDRNVIVGASGSDGARILVVDDDPGVRLLVGRRLQQAGHRVQEAGAAAEALDLVEARGTPDAVVLDVSMPQMDGLELLGRLREQVGRDDLPAVFLSGRVQPEDIEAGRSLGAVYLTKPFVATALLTAIERVLVSEQDTGDGW